MCKAEAEKLITAEVKAILARGEPLDRLLDDHVRASLLARHSALGMYLPHDESTIFSKYAVPIDIVAMKELEGLISKIPGLINIALDGATVNGKQKVRFRLLIAVIMASHTHTLCCCRLFTLLQKAPSPLYSPGMI
jgi:hypothetical protein